jgi:truncated hemoglobin YjbI
MTRNNPIFEASYQRLFGDDVAAGESSSRFFDAFYHRFLADAEIREFFRSTDIARQAAMLRMSFFHLAGFSVLGRPSGELERLAKFHFKLGIENRHYDAWLECLVATVSEFDPACDEVTRMAWRWALTPGMTYMQMYGHFKDQPW